MLTRSNKIAIGVGIVIALTGFTAGVVGFLKGIDASRGDEISAATVATFQDELTGNALAEGVFPVEGFDAYLLLDAYPGLDPSDFEGVASFEGIYRYENGEVQYERTVRQPITSAEKTIAAEGYRTLLRNIVDRLAIDVDDDFSSEQLVQRLKKSNE